MKRKLEKSEELNARAKKVLVGGVNSPVRSFRRVGGTPVFAIRGKGPYVWDADENQYIDLVMSYGPHLFGHARKEIMDAVSRALPHSSCFGMSSEAEIEWAELVLKRFPGAEKIRATSSGTEACATAVRLCRGITGRPLMVKFSGNYHGHVDSLLVSAGSGVATLSTSKETVADSAGIPEQLVQNSRVVEYNDIGALDLLFQKEGQNIAGVILEPIVGNMGVIPPKKEFLHKCRELCTKYGSLLVFDEVMTGLRVHEKSAQGLYGIVPDLTTVGKIVGGGFPLGAVLGPAKFMSHLAPEGSVYQAGTLSGNPVCIAAGIAMLKLIDKERPYDLLEKIGKDWESVLYNEAASAKIPVRVERVGSMISLYFRKDPVTNGIDAVNSDLDKFNQYFWGLVEEGIMIPPSPFEACFLSVAHGEILKSDWEIKIKNVFQKIAKN